MTTAPFTLRERLPKLRAAFDNRQLLADKADAFRAANGRQFLGNSELNEAGLECRYSGPCAVGAMLTQAELTTVMLADRDHAFVSSLIYHRDILPPPSGPWLQNHLSELQAAHDSWCRGEGSRESFDLVLTKIEEAAGVEQVPA
jgi:hypothetical protein